MGALVLPVTLCDFDHVLDKAAIFFLRVSLLTGLTFNRIYGSIWTHSLGVASSKSGWEVIQVTNGNGVAYTKADMAGRRRACPSKVAKPRATEKKGKGTFTPESEIAGRPELTAAGATARSRTYGLRHGRQRSLSDPSERNDLPPPAQPRKEHARGYGLQPGSGK
jgi:hypothetical protein